MSVPPRMRKSNFDPAGWESVRIVFGSCVAYAGLGQVLLLSCERSFLSPTYVYVLIIFPICLLLMKPLPVSYCVRNDFKIWVRYINA